MECEGDPEFHHKPMMQHLKEVHGIDPKIARCSREMIMHLDGRNWFQSNYKWIIDGKKFINFVRIKRNKNTRMY